MQNEDLHLDSFGHVLNGHSPFPVGSLDHSMGHSGPLHTDGFGNLFAIDHLHSLEAHSGLLHQDQFGHVYSGTNPFPVDLHL